MLALQLIGSRTLRGLPFTGTVACTLRPNTVRPPLIISLHTLTSPHAPSPLTVFQAHKFMPHRPDLARHIRLLPNSRAALEDSGRLKQYQRLDWFDVNIAVMDIVLEAKFTQYLSLWDLFSVPATTR